MFISLEKATLKDINKIHEIQVLSFKSLLEKYKDYNMSPGAETIEQLIIKMNQNTTDYHFIKENSKAVGIIRICKLIENEQCKISPIGILPEYQNKGIAQKVFLLIEKMYSPKNGWVLDTILEEHANCYLYEKIGYVKAGKIEFIKPGMNIVYYEKKNA